MYQLERYDGRNRYSCPNCGMKKEFSRYIDENGDYLSDEVGRCNREVNCGYHYSPKQFFFDNPNLKGNRKFTENNKKRQILNSGFKPKRVDFIPNTELLKTMGNYNRNNFIEFLLNRFSANEIQNCIRQYLIGTWTDNRTVFWQVDNQGRVRTGKLIAYNTENGKRVKTVQISWIHAELKYRKELPEDFELEQCLYGEHLLQGDFSKSIGIVESEKTAIVASLYMPDFIWLATGGCKNLQLEKLLKISDNKKIVLFPDSAKFSEWSCKANEARLKFNLNVSVSDLLEKRLNDDEKREDYDLADFLLAN